MAAKRKRGRPPKDGTKATSNLSGVRLTPELHEELKAAAVLEGYDEKQGFADWVRDTLTDKAKCIRKRREQ